MQTMLRGSKDECKICESRMRKGMVCKICKIRSLRLNWRAGR
jgi:hypothetical protein